MPFDKEKADSAVKFIGLLTHSKGKWAGQNFVLEKWQEKIIRDLFGTVTKDGNRQYRTVYIEVPRKNGKTALAAAIALYLLFMDNEPGAEIYAAAADRDQASLVFNASAQMVRSNPALAKTCRIVDSQKRIVYYATNSFYRAIPADAAGAHGFNAHGVIYDELHVAPNRDLYDTLTTSMGAREQPLLVMITTAGYDRNSICWEQHQYAKQVLTGVIRDPSFYACIYAADKEDDWRKMATWKKANPNLGVSISKEFLKQEARRAGQTPAFENTFRRLYLNQWTNSVERWLPMDAWDASAGLVVPESLKGRRCYAGLDLASTTDLAALALVFPSDGAEPAYDVLMHFWVPDEGIRARAHKDRVPYDVWTKQGFITATEGNVIHYAAIQRKIEELYKDYNIQEIAFDRWGATKLSQDLTDAGFLMVPFGQGFASMSPPTKELMNLILSKRLRHGGNPVLRWNADNLVVRQDPAGNLKPDKGKSTEKIDGMVALIMALDRATRNIDTTSIYETRGVVTV